MTDLNKIIEDLSALTVLEAAELAKALEEKWFGDSEPTEFASYDDLSGENGTLTIGVTPFRSMSLMPELVRKLKAKYPGVKVVLHEANAGQLRKDAAEGNCDFVILNLPVDDPALEITPIAPDTLALAVPGSLASEWKNPETGYKEFKTTKYLEDEFEKHPTVP